MKLLQANVNTPWARAYDTFEVEEVDKTLQYHIDRGTVAIISDDYSGEPESEPEPEPPAKGGDESVADPEPEKPKSKKPAPPEEPDED